MIFDLVLTETHNHCSQKGNHHANDAKHGMLRRSSSHMAEVTQVQIWLCMKGSQMRAAPVLKTTNHVPSELWPE